MPAASFVEILAIGKPVALEANAEERDVLGFISITISLPSAGLWANCTFVPPITPIASTILYEKSCMRFWSFSGTVSMGATQKLSPVCTPIASMFSIKQTVIFWPLWSLTTSSSSSSHPSTDSSTNTWFIILAARPLATINLSSSTLYAMPPPVPPIVYAGLNTTGYLSISAIFSASSTDWHGSDFAIPTPIFSMAFLKAIRSSPRSIASIFTPITSTLCFSRIPAL